MFVSPDFPDGLTCLPDLDDECKKSIPKLWSMTLSQPNTKSLERAIKIRLPTLGFTINGETVDLIEIIAVKATPENLNYILDNGVKLHSSDVDAANLGFSFALNYFNFKNASAFLNHGADINRMFANSERTLLSWAVHDGLVDVAKFLIENNADVNLANRSDGSPLHLAVLKNDPVIVNLLMKISKPPTNSNSAHVKLPLWPINLLLWSLYSITFQRSIFIQERAVPSSNLPRALDPSNQQNY